MLEIEGLRVSYPADRGSVVVLRDVELAVAAGTAVALVGESGSGKSTLALSVMRLINPPRGRIEAGSIRLDGDELLTVDRRRMRRILHQDIGYIPQDPAAALDPLCTIYRHINETLSATVPRTERRAAIVELLESLGIPEPSSRLGAYPHEFSGGMKQRITIAIALAKNPKLLIADEPTTALDVTTQLGLLRLIDGLRRERRLSLLFITHDLSVARALCQHVVVLYAGEVMESGAMVDVMTTPRHPYTRALLDAIPRIHAPRERLRAIPGHPPTPVAIQVGCPFAPRCPLADAHCVTTNPPLEYFEGVRVACWKAAEVGTA